MLQFIGLIENIGKVLTVVSVASAITLGWMNHQKGQENKRLENNLYSKTVQYADAEGRLITEVTELRITTKELKQAAKKDANERSELENKLVEAKGVIEDLGIKVKDAERYHKNEIEAIHRDLETSMVFRPDTVYKKLVAINPIKTPNLEIEFEVNDDNIKVDHKYKADVYTVVNRKKTMFTKNGKKRFFVARWINPKWQYSAASMINDPDAEIKSSVDIDFQRRKGKRNG